MTTSDRIKQFLAQIVGAIDSPVPPISTVVACKRCGQRNRRLVGRAGARCGKCGLPLP